MNLLLLIGYQGMTTGSSQWIGAICADRSTTRGHDLTLVPRSRERPDSVATRIADDTGRSAEVIIADLAAIHKVRFYLNLLPVTRI
jgi:short-subunit dehydrogenase